MKLIFMEEFTMKKQMAILMALALSVSTTAAFAEEATAANTTDDAVVIEEALPFEGGAWLTAATAQCEIYLPTGWTITEESETGFTATSEDGAETVAVTVEPLDAATDLVTYMDATGDTYETVAMTNRDAAVVTTEENMTLTFLYDDTTVVRMTFTPGAEGTTAVDNATAIADAFVITADDDATDEAATEEAAADDAAADDAAADDAATETTEETTEA